MQTKFFCCVFVSFFGHLCSERHLEREMERDRNTHTHIHYCISFSQILFLFNPYLLHFHSTGTMPASSSQMSAIGHVKRLQTWYNWSKKLQISVSNASLKCSKLESSQNESTDSDILIVEPEYKPLFPCLSINSFSVQV